MSARTINHGDAADPTSAPNRAPPGPLARSALACVAAGDVDDVVVGLVVDELARRQVPVSLPGLCNLLWFEQGRAGGYDGPAFCALLDSVPTFAHGVVDGVAVLDPQPAVPLGAIVTVQVGNDIAYAEVAWKEGAHPQVDRGWVPGWLAGAPGGAPTEGRPPPDFSALDGDRVLRERLVVDFNRLGEALAPSEAKLARIRRRAKALDRFGHLVADVVYRNGLDEADEVTFWAAWTAANHAKALAAAGVPADPDVLAEAASVLAATLDERDDIRSFGPYYVTAAIYNGTVAIDVDADIGLSRTVRGLAQTGSQEVLGWASMSARLADTCEEETLIGLGWPKAVVCASLLTLDTLSAEAPDGDWQGVHLRLDDTWQGGGLWRTERLDYASPVDADPAVALGLGWVAHAGGEISRTADAPDVIDAPEWFDDNDDLDWDVPGSEATWLLHLSTTDIDTDRLRLPAAVSSVLAETLYTRGQDQLLIRLRHDGESEAREWAGLGPDGHLCLPWPLGVLPGTTVRLSWQVGATVVSAATTLLETPTEIAGITYTHAFSLAVALAAAGVVERGNRTATIRQLVRAAVRRYGDITEDGYMAMNLDDVVERCFGPGGEVVPGVGRPVMRQAVLTAVRGMAATGSAHLEGDLVVVSVRLTEAGRRADANLIARFVDATQQRLRRQAQRHWVPPTVVNLPTTHQRSEAKEATWNEVAGTEGLPEGPLEPGQTWRRGHLRGRGIPADLKADLDRAKEALSRLAGTSAAASLEGVVSDPFDNEPATNEQAGAPPPQERTQ